MKTSFFLSRQSIISISLSLFIAFFTTFKANLSYTSFHKNNIPVYDGVMYERAQIRSHMRFHENYSMLERFNQVYWEFTGNISNAGFNCGVILLNPNWLTNDIDVILRGFISVFLFSLVLMLFLKDRVPVLESSFIILLLFQLPVFYNFRVGITSYIPELTSALLLLAGYIQILNYFKYQKNIQLYTAGLLIIAAILSRLNFVVFAFLIIAPLSFKYFKTLKSLEIKSKRLQIIYISIGIAFISVYFLFHLNSFLNYYTPNILYQQKDLTKSLITLIEDLNEQIGIIGFGALLLIFILVNYRGFKAPSVGIKLRYYIFPFLIHFAWVILYMQASTVPHAISSMVVYFSFIFILPIKINKIPISNRIRNLILVLFTILFISLNVKYTNYLQANTNTIPQHKGSKAVADFILKEDSLTQDYKYICFYDEKVEIPIDVYIYKKTGIWINSITHFYHHDTYLYELNKTLNDTACASFYIDKIKKSHFNLIAINKSPKTIPSEYKLAKKVNNLILEHLKTSDKYHVGENISNKQHGNIVLYKKKRLNID